MFDDLVDKKKKTDIRATYNGQDLDGHGHRMSLLNGPSPGIDAVFHTLRDLLIQGEVHRRDTRELLNAILKTQLSIAVELRELSETLKKRG